MRLKDRDGIYKNWVPVAIVAAALIYCALVIFYVFPAIDAAFKK